MDKLKDKRLWIALVAIVIIIFGGVYFHESHAVASDVPGHVYRYDNSSNDRVLYLAFAQKGDHVIVTGNKQDAINADKNQNNFNQAYQKQSKDATWEYKADGNKLTLAKIKSKNNISQWEYLGILSTHRKFVAHGFNYQIAKAGQGKVNKRMVFQKVN